MVSFQSILKDFIVDQIKFSVIYFETKLSITHLYNKAQFMFVCVSASVLAIFMDRFWNQGYLWTPHDPGMNTKI